MGDLVKEYLMEDKIDKRRLCSALIQSARDGHLNVIKYLVDERHVDIHTDNDLALRVSASYGYLPLVKYLALKGANVHAENEDAIYMAAMCGRLEVVKYLAEEHKCDVHLENGRALISSAENGHFDVVKYLGDEHNAGVHADKERALILSAGKGHLDVVKYLVSIGANVHYKNGYAMSMSARNGHLPLVKYFVDELNVTVDADNGGALIGSASKGHLEVVKHLVEKGADIHAGNGYAAMWSAGAGHLEVVKYLVSHGADIHKENEYALVFSAAAGHLEVVKYLVEECSADTHKENEYALVFSAAAGHLEVVKYLVGKGANVDVDFEWDTCPEDFPILKCLDVVKYLLSVGVPIERMETWIFTICLDEGLVEDAEYIAQFFPKRDLEKIFEDPKEFHEFNEFCYKYGIIYEGSNYPPMEDEYKKRKELRGMLKAELYEKSQEILYRPGGIRSLLMEERFYENASKIQTSHN